MNLIPIYKHSVVGVTGTYTTENLPGFVTKKISRGLTDINDRGEVKPSIAQSWKILDRGKTYVFSLRKDQYFSDGRNITSDLVNYNFSDVNVERPDKYTIVYKLKDVYAPFLVTVSRPIFQHGLIGSGEYRIDDVKINGNFIQSLTMVGVKNKFDVLTYEFYPTIEALEYAYVLGEVNQAMGLGDIKFKDTSYVKFNNTSVNENIDYTKLVTLFYNNNDSILSDKKIRLALSYALPNEYAGGQRSFLPYPQSSVYYNRELEDKKQNIEHAKLLLSASNTASGSAEIKLTIKTLNKYEKLAREIAKNFEQINVKTNIEKVDGVPSNFQVYLGDFSLSNDPDQYLLWHSDQSENITKYKNLRIDKLLEDGRKTVDVSERIRIYDDFQKFLIEDAPASFLYFPKEYDLVRK